MVMVQIILLSLAACIAFNFLFVYVIDFKGKILKDVLDQTDVFDVFIGCIVIAPISTVCFILLWICVIGIKICSCYEWLDAHTISKEYNFVKRQNRRLRPVIREFNEFLKTSTT